jgi:hypothetical protein
MGAPAACRAREPDRLLSPVKMPVPFAFPLMTTLPPHVNMREAMVLPVGQLHVGRG